MFSRGGPEEVFTKGGDEPEAGVAPRVWDMKRVEQVQEVIDRFYLDCKAVPEPP